MLGIVAVSVVRESRNFQGTMYRAHCAVIFAIAQLSCYRAMHFSAERGLAIACRLSVRLSVSDVGDL